LNTYGDERVGERIDIRGREKPHLGAKRIKKGKR